MNNVSNIKWHIDVFKHMKGTFLLGLNFNTNDELGEREVYINLYFGRYTISIGKFDK